MYSESDLYAYYSFNANMSHRKLMTITEAENLIPYEREIYTTIYEQIIEEEKKKNKALQNR